MGTVFHRTSFEAAERILEEGFKTDGFGAHFAQMPGHVTFLGPVELVCIVVLLRPMPREVFDDINKKTAEQFHTEEFSDPALLLWRERLLRDVVRVHGYDGLLPDNPREPGEVTIWNPAAITVVGL